MKRTIHFKLTDTGYGCFEEDKRIFEISKKDLQFNVKEFYQAFYAENNDYENIEILNHVEDDKDASRVYQCIVTLMEKIKEKLAEMPEDEDVSGEGEYEA